jgi:PASTA domain
LRFISPALVRQRPIGKPEIAVPDVVGLDWDEALVILREVDLSASHADGPTGAGGVVTAQQPHAGFVVPRGSSITLWVRRGPGSAGFREPRRPKPGPLSARDAVTNPGEEEHA